MVVLVVFIALFAVQLTVVGPWALRSRESATRIIATSWANQWRNFEPLLAENRSDDWVLQRVAMIPASDGWSVSDDVDANDELVNLETLPLDPGDLLKDVRDALWFEKSIRRHTLLDALAETSSDDVSPGVLYREYVYLGKRYVGVAVPAERADDTERAWFVAETATPDAFAASLFVNLALVAVCLPFVVLSSPALRWIRLKV